MYHSIDQTKISSTGSTTTVGCTLGGSLTGLDVGVTNEWSYSSDAFNCKND